MAEIRIRGLEKFYGGHRAIKGIDLDIAEGSFVALVGPSGCGKSTLLRMIAGLEEISGGELWIGDRVVNGLPPRERNVAMVFQNYALYPHMTVAQNMGFSMRLRHAPPAESEAAVKQAADMLGLGALLDRFPGQLSGGQRQRVAMGRAIVRRPQVFLFDEPLSNLDAALRVQMRAEIRALHRRVATTTVYVTHDQIEAMTMADVVVVMREGVIEQAGPPLDLFDRPANLFVAGFIGSPAMNFLAGEVVGGAQPALQLPGGTQLSLPDFAASHAGRRATLGIRPEQMRLGAAGASAGQGHSGQGLWGEVVSLEAPGISTHFDIDTIEGRVQVVAHERLALRLGDRVEVSADPAALHLFDTASGQRLG